MRALEIDPNFATALGFLALIQLARGQFEEAVDYIEKTPSEHPFWLALKGQHYGFAGRRDDALHVLDQLKDRAQHSYVSPYAFVWVYHGLGDLQSLKTAMQASIEERNGLLIQVNAPWNDSIRQEPFFQEFVRKLNLPPVSAA